jgi:hypothetical protein
MAHKPFPYNESIRVVPLHQPSAQHFLNEKKKKKKKAPTTFTYRGGPLLKNVEVFTIFWGSGWQATDIDLAVKINQFFRDILQSSLLDQMGEYSVPDYKIGKGVFTDTVTLEPPSSVQMLTDTEIQHQLLNWIKTVTVPKPNENTLYFIYLDEGITVSLGGGSSCSSFCGYHNNADKQTFYAVMPYPE